MKLPKRKFLLIIGLLLAVGILKQVQNDGRREVRAQAAPTAPWFVTEGGDIHAGSLVGGLPVGGAIKSEIPKLGLACNQSRCNIHHYKIKNLEPEDSTKNIRFLSLKSRFSDPANKKPGVVSCSGSVQTGDGDVSSESTWVFQGPSGTKFDIDRIKYGYDYFKRLWANETKIPWDGATEPDRSGIFEYTGDALIDWGTATDFGDGNGTISTNWVISGGKRITLLVGGNVRVKKGIRFAGESGTGGGMLAIVASGNILFHKDIQSGDFSGGAWTDKGQRIGGVFVADGQIVTCADDIWSDCDMDTETSHQILFGGLFTAWSGFKLNRNLDPDGSLGDLNSEGPAEVFVYIPEFAACLPDYFKRPLTFWQEEAPGN